MSISKAKRFVLGLLAAFVVLSGTAYACTMQVAVTTTETLWCDLDHTWKTYTFTDWKTIQVQCGGGGGHFSP